MNIAIVARESRFTYTLKRQNLKSSEVSDYFIHSGLTPDRVQCIFDSHERQQDACRRIKSLFPKAVEISHEDLTKETLAAFSMVVALGGDNHFQKVASFLEGTPIIGVNTDPVTSHGWLTKWKVEELEATPNILQCPSEDWTRLEVAINGRPLSTLALSEIYIGEENRLLMSRCRAKFTHTIPRSEMEIPRDVDVTVRSSGLIVATGSGSTGWFSSAGGSHFPQTENSYKLIAAEPFGASAKTLRFYQNTPISTASEVTSLNDNRGILAIDALRTYPFPEGSVATIKLGLPLKAIVNHA